MGTTLPAAKVHGDAVSLGHVGDSRAYLLREGSLEQLTKDHSLVAELERTGQISPEAAEHHPQRSIITRALGPARRGGGHVHDRRARGRHLALLGWLTGMVSDDELSSILRSAEDLEQAAEALVRAANQSGGKDNITVVLFRLTRDELQQGAAGDSAGTGDEATPPGR